MYEVYLQTVATGEDVWVESGQVTVPAGTKRRTVIEKALDELGITVAPGEVKSVLVIPKEYAEPVSVTSVQPEPQLLIGGTA